MQHAVLVRNPRRSSGVRQQGRVRLQCLPYLPYAQTYLLKYGHAQTCSTIMATHLANAANTMGPLWDSLLSATAAKPAQVLLSRCGVKLTSLTPKEGLVRSQELRCQALVLRFALVNTRQQFIVFSLRRQLVSSPCVGCLGILGCCFFRCVGWIQKISRL